MGAKRWSRVSMDAGYLADPLAAGIWEAKIGAIWGFLGRQVGPCKRKKKGRCAALSVVFRTVSCTQFTYVLNIGFNRQ